MRDVVKECNDVIAAQSSVIEEQKKTLVKCNKAMLKQSGIIMDRMMDIEALKSSIKMHIERAFKDQQHIGHLKTENRLLTIALGHYEDEAHAYEEEVQELSQDVKDAENESKRLKEEINELRSCLKTGMDIAKDTIALLESKAPHLAKLASLIEDGTMDACLYDADYLNALCPGDDKNIRTLVGAVWALLTGKTL